MRFRLTYLIMAVLVAATVVAARQSGPAQAMFEAARKMEVVDGDLNGAIKQYQAIVDKYKTDRSVTATALVQMAGCYEKLGQSDAQKTYERVVREFADQADSAATARMRLASIAGAAPAAGKTAMTVRQVWTGLGEAKAISRDGRYLAYAGGGVGLSVRDLFSGEDRRLTVPDSDHFIFSPDGKLIAYQCKKCANGGRDEIRLIAPDGSAPRVLNVSYDGPVLFPIEWAADGKHLLAGATNQNGNRQLVFASVPDGSVRVVMTLEGGALTGGRACPPMDATSLMPSRLEKTRPSATSSPSPPTGALRFRW